MANMEILTLAILDTVGQVPDIEIQSLWGRVCVTYQSPAKEEFLESLCTLQQQGSLVAQELNGVCGFRLVACGELVDAEDEYCEEFAQKILAIEANEKFTEIDCDVHLAYLDSLIEQARPQKETRGKLD